MFIYIRRFKLKIRVSSLPRKKLEHWPHSLLLGGAAKQQHKGHGLLKETALPQEAPRWGTRRFHPFPGHGSRLFIIPLVLLSCTSQPLLLRSPPHSLQAFEWVTLTPDELQRPLQPSQPVAPPRISQLGPLPRRSLYDPLRQASAALHLPPLCLHRSPPPACPSQPLPLPSPCPPCQPV